MSRMDKQSQFNQTNLDLNYVVPIVVSDGNGVFISDPGDVPMLTFFQVRKQEGNRVSADVVAAVRLNSLTDLENLRNSIDETIRKHKDRER
jgi:hypothetical protein